MKTKGKKSNTLFKKPKHKYLSKIISFKNPNKAKESAKKLEKEFNKAKTKKKKLRIARASQYASNRAGASMKRKKLSQKEKNEFRQISNIYDKTADKLFEKYNNIKS